MGEIRRDPATEAKISPDKGWREFGVVLHAPEIDPFTIDGKRLNAAVAVAGKADGAFGKTYHLSRWVQGTA